MFAALTLALALVPQDPAAAQSAGDEMLSIAQAAGVFRNVSTGGFILLKHSASGLTCAFDPAAQRNNVRVYPVRPTVENRGDDVGCGTTDAAAYTVYATRYRPNGSEAAAMAQAIQEVEAIWGGVQRLDIAAPAGFADGSFAAFRGRHPNGQSLSTVILVRQIGPWSFKMRASGPPDHAESMARMAAERFVIQLPQTSAARP